MELEESGLQRSRGERGFPGGSPFETLAEPAIVQDLPRGALLFAEGEAAEVLYVLLEGMVALYGGRGVRSTVVELVQPVDCPGLEAVLGATRHLLSARTLEPSRLLAAPADEVRRRMVAEPRLALALLDCLAADRRRLIGQIKDLKLHGTTERLGCWLLQLMDEHGDGGWTRLSVPKGTIAQLLGMTAESLSRAFATLRRHGLEVRGSRIRIVDRTRLEALCRLEPAGG